MKNRSIIARIIVAGLAIAALTLFGTSAAASFASAVVVASGSGLAEPGIDIAPSGTIYIIPGTAVATTSPIFRSSDGS